MKSGGSLDCNKINIRKSIIAELPALAELRWALCSDDEETELPVDKAHFYRAISEKREGIRSYGELNQLRC